MLEIQLRLKAPKRSIKTRDKGSEEEKNIAWHPLDVTEGETVLPTATATHYICGVGL